MLQDFNFKVSIRYYSTFVLLYSKILNLFYTDSQISFFSLLLDNTKKYISAYLCSYDEMKNIPSYNTNFYARNSFFSAHTGPIENYREVGAQFAEYVKNSRNKFFYLI